MPCGDDVTMSMFQLECERAERMRLEHAVKTGSLPDDCKMGVATLGAELAAAKLSYSAGASAILFSRVSAMTVLVSIDLTFAVLLTPTAALYM